MGPAVADDIHETDQGFVLACCHPEQAVLAQPLVPRDRDALMPERKGVECTELIIVNTLSHAVLHVVHT